MTRASKIGCRFSTGAPNISATLVDEGRRKAGVFGAVEKTKKLYSGESAFAMPIGVLHQDISES